MMYLKKDNQMKPIVFYHKSCVDGQTSAYAAWLRLGDDVEYFPIQYGTINSITDISLLGVLVRDIYILDFSFPKDVMDAIIAASTKFVWLDHHRTSFETWSPSNLEYFTQGTPNDKDYILLDNNKSGAMLSWEYFMPEVEVPILVQHVSDYDLWTFDVKGTKEINRAIWTYYPWRLKQWGELFGTYEEYINGNPKHPYQKLYEIGSIILEAHEGNVKSLVRQATTRCVIVDPITSEVYIGLACNCPPVMQSDVGHELANQSKTFGLLWYINNKNECLISLRSNGDYDVSKIAKNVGNGGGHLNAAGGKVDIQTLLSWLSVAQ